jgi:MtaA/CmuA family methyltransferase
MELRFAKAQVEAGADMIGLGDAAASLVGPRIYEEFVLPYEKRLVDGLHAMGVKVRLHICGNIRRILPGIATLGCDMMDVDWMVPLDQGRRELGPKQVMAGNIDPVAVLRNGTPQQVTDAIADCHKRAGANYIVGAGCEVCRDTPEANVVALCDSARTAT